MTAIAPTAPKSRECPFCGEGHLTHSLPSRFGCGRITGGEEARSRRRGSLPDVRINTKCLEIEKHITVEL